MPRARAGNPRGPVPVKGLTAPIEIFEVSGAGPVRSRLHAAAARGLTRFVGRDGNCGRCTGLERARAGQGQVVGVVGEPGVGKSRLLWEFTHSPRLRDWLSLESGSVSYGKAVAYLPVVGLLKTYFQIDHRDGHRTMREKVTAKMLSLDRTLEPALPAILALLDVPLEDPAWQALDPSERRQQTLDAVKRLLLRETRAHPVVVVFEDLHWIDTETQAVLDSVVESLPTSRLLLIVNYRPEYRARLGQQDVLHQLRIDPLPAEGADELLRRLLGTDPALQPLMSRSDPEHPRQSILPGGVRAHAGRNRRALRRTKCISTPGRCAEHPGSGVGASHPRGPNRPPPRRRQAVAPDRRR